MSGQHHAQKLDSTSVTELHFPLRSLLPRSVSGIVGATTFIIDLVVFVVLAVLRENTTVAEVDGFAAVLGIASVVLIVLNLAAVIVGSTPRFLPAPR